jgi:hypothetical protein
MRHHKREFTLKKRAMIKALERSLCVVTSACRIARIGRATHYRWMSIDSKYREAVLDIDNEALDFVEAKLLESIGNGSFTATIFYLKTKGKKRGYVEKTEVEQVISPEVKDFEIRQLIK